MSGDAGALKEIPYGISDFPLIRSENYYYVDKTPYLQTLNKAGRYLFFIRPRRFGKSLFISMMESYYDIARKDRFEDLFSGTWIFDHPTHEQGKYMVLVFNFSEIDTNTGDIAQAFADYVRGVAVEFFEKYSGILSANKEYDYFTRTIRESNSAPTILSNLYKLCKKTRKKTYVLIDEYDNFANDILVNWGTGAYHDLTRGTGILRSFFNVVKAGTTHSDSPFTRIFITGVSPVTMDDVTSGYNIGTNISLDLDFNRMLGFNRDDVIHMIDYYRSQGLVNDSTESLLEIITRWYGNYRFSAKGEGIVFNSDMVLYFLKNYIHKKRVPDDLVDENVKIDYGKLRHLILIDKGKGKDKGGKGDSKGDSKTFNGKTFNGNFEKLKGIIEDGGVETGIIKGFSIDKVGSTVNFNSLLFYMGLLSIKREERDKYYLEIPNETVKRLYYNYVIYIDSVD